MTRIDFYLLQDVALEAMHRFACALAGKAVHAGSQVFIHSPNAEEHPAIDDLLWRYPPDRFVPHAVGVANASRTPVIIDAEPPMDASGLMINLSLEVPPFFGRFDRVAEIVVGAAREQGRERYKHYRDRGCPLYHHELDDWE